MFTNKYRKSLSPLITTILLIVVTFALIGIILGWGKNFTNNTKTTLDSFSETYTKDSTSMIKPIKFYPNNRLVVNDLMSKKDLTITGYRILSDKNLPGLNTTVTLSQPLVLSTGDSASLIISRPPEKKFDLQLLTNDSKYITVSDITNYPLEPISPVINTPISGNNYNSDQNILFSQTTTGGDGIYSCVWKVNGTQIHTGCDDFNYSFSSSGTKTISLTASDAENNNYTTTSSLVIYPPLSLSITSPTNNSTYLYNSTINFTSTVTGGSGTHSCSWISNIDGNLGAGCDINASNLSIGTHKITLSVIDGSETTTDENLIIKSDLIPSITSPSNNSTFTNDSTIEFIGSATNTSGSYSCSWDSNIDGSLGTGCDINASNLSIGTHLITLNVTDNLETISTTELINIISAPLSAVILSPTNSSYNVNTSLSFSSNISGGDGIYSCLWKDNSVDLNSDCNFTHTYLSDSWTNKNSMLTARKYLTSSVVNGKIYAIGGYNGSALNTVEEYDPVTNTWTTKTSMYYARSGLTSSVVNGKIYAIGGYNGSSRLTTVEEYDPAINTWTTRAPMKYSRSDLTSSVVNGKIYAIGGYNGNYLTTVEEYNPATNTWTTRTPMKYSRNSLTSSVVNGKIYAIGGYNGSSRLTTVEEYDPATNTWTTRTPMKYSRNSLTSSVVNGKIYAIGGGSSSGNVIPVEEYNPITNNWVTVTNIPTARYGLTSSVVNDKIYVIGGEHGSPINTVEEYNPGDYGNHNIVLDVNDSSGNTTSTDVNITIN